MVFFVVARFILGRIGLLDRSIPLYCFLRYPVLECAVVSIVGFGRLPFVWPKISMARISRAMAILTSVMMFGVFSSRSILPIPIRCIPVCSTEFAL